MKIKKCHWERPEPLYKDGTVGPMKSFGGLVLISSEYKGELHLFFAPDLISDFFLNHGFETDEAKRRVQHVVETYDPEPFDKIYNSYKDQLEKSEEIYHSVQSSNFSFRDYRPYFEQAA